MKNKHKADISYPQGEIKATSRETEIWERSAAKHDKDGEPVAAALSQHLEYIAQEARDEYEEIRQAAEIQHKAAVEATKNEETL